MNKGLNLDLNNGIEHEYHHERFSSIIAAILETRNLHHSKEDQPLY